MDEQKTLHHDGDWKVMMYCTLPAPCRLSDAICTEPVSIVLFGVYIIARPVVLDMNF